MRLTQIIPAAAWTMAVTLAGCEMKYNGSWDTASQRPQIEPPTPVAQQHAQAPAAQPGAAPQAAAIHPVTDTHGRDIQFETPADVNFDGEVSVARCQTVAVECAPANSKTPNAFVFSARDSDGAATNGTTVPRKRVYITITE